MDKAALGKKIREHRKSRGITGKELAARTGLSAAAISKFETGHLRPNESLVEKVIEALELPRTEATGLRELGALFNSQFRRWASQSEEVAQNQQIVGKRERSCKLIRCYMSQIVHGLLQSENYMRALFKTMESDIAADTERLISFRKKRQKILNSKGKTFVFVLHETALRTVFMNKEALLDQLAYLQELIDSSSNVEIRTLPVDKVLTRLPLNHFILYDERTVNIETLKGDLDLWTEEDVQYHIELMNYLVSVSLSPKQSRAFIGKIKKSL